MVSTYVEPDYRPEELVDVHACSARAQRALETAEQQLDAEVTGGLSVPEMLAATQVRAEIGRGWAELGAHLRGGAR